MTYTRKSNRTKLLLTSDSNKRCVYSRHANARRYRTEDDGRHTEEGGLARVTQISDKGYRLRGTNNLSRRWMGAASQYTPRRGLSGRRARKKPISFQGMNKACATDSMVLSDSDLQFTVSQIVSVERLNHNIYLS